MKKLLSIIILFASYLSAYAEDLVITKLNPSPIKIGNKTLTKGGTFSDADVIYWSSEKQDMKAKPKNGGLPRHFSAAAFRNKSKRSLSVKQYYNKTNHPSTLGIDMVLQESNTKDGFPEKRIALVIGNSLYQYMPDLDCPISDAEDVSDKLSELGFDTYTLYDVNHEDFINALKKFSGAAQSYDVALVYYCGHGNQNDGMNYLLPVNAKNDRPDDIELWVSFDFIFKKMAETECDSKILFLNACRNTPGWKKAEPGSRLDRYNTNGSLVVYSTSNGEVALAEDEEMRNTPFTASFLANVAKPADNISQIIQSISADLRERTRYLEDYGESPQQVYTFGVGDVDFTFVKEKCSYDKCVVASRTVDLLTQNHNALEAIKYGLDFAYNDSILSPQDYVPYTPEIDRSLRAAFNSIISQRWQNLRIDDLGRLDVTEDGKYIFKYTDSLIVVLDVQDFNILSSIRIKKNTLAYCYVRGEIYLFNDDYIQSFSAIDGSFIRNYDYDSFNNYNVIKYLFYNKNEIIKQMLTRWHYYLGLSEDIEIIDYDAVSNIALIDREELLDPYEIKHRVILYDCSKQQDIITICDKYEVDGQITYTTFSNDGKNLLVSFYSGYACLINLVEGTIRDVSCGNGDCYHYSNKYMFCDDNLILHCSRFENSLKIIDFETLNVIDSVPSPDNEEIYEAFIYHDKCHGFLATAGDFFSIYKNTNYNFIDTIIECEDCLREIINTDFNEECDDVIVEIFDKGFAIKNKQNDILWEYQCTYGCNDILFIDNTYFAIVEASRWGNGDFVIFNLNDGGEIFRFESPTRIAYKEQERLFVFFNESDIISSIYYFPKYSDLIKECQLLVSDINFSNYTIKHFKL